MAICITAKVPAQSEPDNYRVAVTKFIKFYNANQPDSVFAMFGPEMRAALPSESWRTTTKQIKDQLGDLLKADFYKYTPPIAQYHATFQKGEFTLNIGLNSTDQFIGIRLTPPEAAPAASAAISDPALTESAITLKSLSGNIYGTLTMPKDVTGKIPVVLIIAGSGPTDRDGNNKFGLNTNTYKLLAGALAKAGIASVRYDKRLIGQSVGTQKESDLRFDDYIDDAMGFINLLNDDQRFSKIIVAGHSEGSLIGMIACFEEPVKGFISLAGAGQPGELVMTQQMKAQPQYLQDNFKRMMDSLKRGKNYNEIDPALWSLARPSIQNYLMSWCRRSPQLELKKLKIPILIIQGTNDVQVSLDNAQKLKDAKSSATLDIIHGMNHILKDAPAEREANLATYKDPNLPLNTQMVTDIIDFIKK